MALLTASDLHKDIAGQPLLRGVSFKLERRDRMTIAGRNGAGKTTLLRMLAGESTIDRGELSLARGVRLALHDQRPPRSAVRRCATTFSPAAPRSSRSRRDWPNSRRRWRPAAQTRHCWPATRTRRRAWRRAAATAGAIAPRRWRTAWASRPR